MSYDALLSRLHKPRRAALRAGATRAHRAHCPACQADGSGNPALSVAEGAGGGVLVYCFKGCSAVGGVERVHELQRHENFAAAGRAAARQAMRGEARA